MAMYDKTAWGVVIGLALLVVGGLMFWVYGNRTSQQTVVLNPTGPEAESTTLLHLKLIRWFYIYGVCLCVVGGFLLLRSVIRFF